MQVAPNGEQLWISKGLCILATNNITEYEAFIYELEVIIVVGAKEVKVIGDALLVNSHIREVWKNKEDRFRLYPQYAKQLLQAFK